MEITFEQCVAYVNQCLLDHRGQRLKDGEYWALKASWEDLTYEDIANHPDCHYDDGSIKNDGSQLWKLLAKIWQEKVTKKRFRQIAIARLNPKSTIHPGIPPGPPPKPPPISGNDLGELPPTLIPCRGRTSELDALVAQINDPQTGLIVLSGLSGSGKTLLLNQLPHKVSDQFQILYRDVRSIPTLEQFCLTVLRWLQVPQTSTPDAPEQLLAEVMQHLRQTPCLILLDGTEHLYQPSRLVGQFKPESRGYEDLLRWVMAQPLRSCLIWAGQEPPNLSYRPGLHVCELGAVAEVDAIAIIQQQFPQISGTPADWQSWVQWCGGNPGLLLSVAYEIASLYQGHLAAFLQQEKRSWLPSYRDWATQFERLSSDERTIAVWLMLTPLSWDDLHTRLPDLAQSPGGLMPIRRSLHSRSLIRWDTTTDQLEFTFPLLRRWVAAQFTHAITQEILNATPHLLHHHPIRLATAPEYLQQWQQDHLLEPIVHQLRQVCSHPSALQARLARLLETLRLPLDSLRTPHTQIKRSYAPGSILTIALHLGLDVHQLDFSGLPLQQVDLRQADLQQVNFTGCTFQSTLFSAGLKGGICAAVNHDGSLLAAGDLAGRVVIWHHQNGELRLIGHQHLGHSIEALVWMQSDLAVAIREATPTGNTTGQVHLIWGINQDGSTNVDANFFRTTGAEVMPTALCLSPDENWLAATQNDGSVGLWHLENQDHKLRMLPCEFDMAQFLAFDPQSRYLAVCGDDFYGDVWEVKSGKRHERIPASPHYCLKAIVWGSTQSQLAVESRDTIIQVRRLGEPLLHHLCHSTAIIAIALSPDTHWLATSTADNTIHLWEVETGQKIACLTDFPHPVQALMFTADRRLLLTNSRLEAQLWSMESFECLCTVTSDTQEQSPSPSRYAGLVLTPNSGLSSLTEDLLWQQGAIPHDDASL